jgi:hypothetical protein
VSNTFLFPKMREAKVTGKARLYVFSPENTQEEYLRRQLQTGIEIIPGEGSRARG